MSSRVVILGGAGAMGRITARDLARTGRGTVQVVVADREEALAALTPSGRSNRPRSPAPGAVEMVAVDVTDAASLQRALTGAFAVIASLPYRFNLLAMQGALAAGCHYLDLGGLFHMTRRQLELGPEFARAHRTAILGIGSAPGIINVLAADAARDLDAVREVHCLVGSVDRTRFRSAPPLGFGYSVETLLDEFAMPSAVFRKGAFGMVPPLDPRERIAVRFPPPIGTLPVDTTLHSEVATLPAFFADGGIREVTFRQGFDRGFMEKLRLLVDLGLADTSPLSPALTDVTPRQVLLALLGRLPAAVPAGRPDRHEVLRALVRGRRGRQSVAIAADCYAGSRAGGGIGPDIDTGAPPSIVVQLMLGGRMELRPGVWAPEQAVPIEPFFREVRRRGMRLTRRVIKT